MIVKKHLKKEEVDEIVKKLKKLGLKEVEEKHEALIHRYDARDGVIKIYKKLKKKDDFAVVISGSSDFEAKIKELLFGETETVSEDAYKSEITIGVDESGVDNAVNFVVSGISYRIFDLIDSKKVSKERLGDYVMDILKNSEFTAIFKFHRGLLDYIREKGYTIGDIVKEVAVSLQELFNKIGLDALVLVDGAKPEGAVLPDKVKYLGKGGELRDRNVAAAGVISTYFRRILN
ncbi:MAG: hypothetical protein ACP6IP_06030 [Candidatus Njordarchaeia archaeon]